MKTKTLLALILIMLSGCASVENTIERHPVITTVAVVAVTAVITGYVVQKRARNEFEREAMLMEQLQ